MKCAGLMEFSVDKRLQRRVEHREKLTRIAMKKYIELGEFSP
jgi:hypothetical protein